MPRVLVEKFTVTPDAIDMNGHVNNQAYVGWMQDIATAHSEAQGWTLARYLEAKTTWVIRSHYVEYLRPAFAEDELLVATWVAGMDLQSSPRRYRFARAGDGKTLVRAETVWVFCDASSGRALDISPEVRNAFPVVTDETEVEAAIATGRA